LRRAALGIVKIILERKLPVSLSLGIGAAGKALLGHKPKRGVSPDQESKILAFLLDRARFVFREREQFAYDEVSAVFRAGADDLVDTEKRLLALRAIRKSRNFEPLAVSFKRIRKILEKAGVAPGEDVNPALFESAAERELHSGATAAAAKVESLKRGGKYQEALEPYDAVYAVFFSTQVPINASA
jgi:glycyl-tRNA synthetase beta chain